MQTMLTCYQNIANQLKLQLNCAVPYEPPSIRGNVQLFSSQPILQRVPGPRRALLHGHTRLEHLTDEATSFGSFWCDGAAPLLGAPPS